MTATLVDTEDPDAVAGIEASPGNISREIKSPPTGQVASVPLVGVVASGTTAGNEAAPTPSDKAAGLADRADLADFAERVSRLSPRNRTILRAVMEAVNEMERPTTVPSGSLRLIGEAPTPNATQNSPFGRLDFAEKASDVETDLLYAVRSGAWPPLCWDDPAFITDSLAEGVTEEEIAEGRADYIARRERLFIALRRLLDSLTVRRPNSPSPATGAAGTVPTEEEMPHYLLWSLHILHGIAWDVFGPIYARLRDKYAHNADLAEIEEDPALGIVRNAFEIATTYLTLGMPFDEHLFGLAQDLPRWAKERAEGDTEMSDLLDGVMTLLDVAENPSRSPEDMGIQRKYLMRYRRLATALRQVLREEREEALRDMPDTRSAAPDPTDTPAA